MPRFNFAKALVILYTLCSALLVFFLYAPAFAQNGQASYPQILQSVLGIDIFTEGIDATNGEVLKAQKICEKADSNGECYTWAAFSDTDRNTFDIDWGLIDTSEVDIECPPGEVVVAVTDGGFICRNIQMCEEFAYQAVNGTLYGPPGMLIPNASPSLMGPALGEGSVPVCAVSVGGTYAGGATSVLQDPTYTTVRDTLLQQLIANPADASVIAQMNDFFATWYIVASANDLSTLFSNVNSAQGNILATFNNDLNVLKRDFVCANLAGMERNIQDISYEPYLPGIFEDDLLASAQAFYCQILEDDLVAQGFTTYSSDICITDVNTYAASIPFNAPLTAQDICNTL